MKKKLNSPTISVLILTLVLAMLNNARAQVTIGANHEPQTFSVLELISDNTMGLRLPQMSTTQRDAMVLTQAFLDEKNGKARGLQIFNTTTLCVETWNGTKWIEICDHCVFPAFMSTVYNFCSEDNSATIADLAAKIGSDVYIYDALTDGNKYDDNAPLTLNTYYVEQIIEDCTPPVRTAVTVNRGSCNTLPNANITAFVNVMYDFQHQTIEAYSTAGIGTDYLWEVGTNSSNFTPVPDAPNSPFFTIPADFSDRYNSGGYLCDTLWFRCTITNPKGSVTTANNLLDIIFIKTVSSGYETDEANGVKYLKLGKGAGGINDGSAAKMKVALLNLGQSADWTPENGYVPNNDAGDLGDFYQWGRAADGHQNVVWSKAENRVNQIVQMTGGVNTSAPVARGTTTYDANGQIPSSATTYYGKFITHSGSGTDQPGDWHVNPGSNSLWGTGTDYATRASDVPLSGWSDMGKNNNPCPSSGSTGWHIPSRWNVWDLYRGDGIDTQPDTTHVYKGTNNTWQWRASNGTPVSSVGTAIGGAIITNSSGEKIFMPASGCRKSSDGNSTDMGKYGNYWSNACDNRTNYAYDLDFGKDNDTKNAVNPCDDRLLTFKASGRCARCAAEVE
ncbi:MAG: hypothetical protein LBB53_04635 [Prevotellaceae bacterium]|jgi:hypothetical protein|nr:hypothetical protein [Prevotellaceae bacterium]